LIAVTLDSMNSRQARAREKALSVEYAHMMDAS
jgi:hypothetical protein